MESVSGQRKGKEDWEQRGADNGRGIGKGELQLFKDRRENPGPESY
mgnify:CR=1 FL=1